MKLIFLCSTFFVVPILCAVDLTVFNVNCTTDNPEVLDFPFFSHDKLKYNISAVIKKPLKNVLVR